jgi:hypothetical protein
MIVTQHGSEVRTCNQAQTRARHDEPHRGCLAARV